MSAPKLPINTDTLLILEKGFESGQSIQDGTDNLTVIEQLLLTTVEQLNVNDPSLIAKFIVRRLPTYTVSYFTKNEYAVVLEALDFTLGTPSSSVTETVSIDEKPIKINLGHTEVYRRKSEEPSTSSSNNAENNCNGHNSKPYGSHEIFQRFSSAFVKIFSAELERETKRREEDGVEKVQLIGPHLLHAVRCNAEVQKVFTLVQSELLISSKKKGRCKFQINHESCMITIELDGIEAIVRPALFLKSGYPKINCSVLERIPLHHPSILLLGESLLKGCLLIPTNYETLWTIQFWPSESHIIFGFHPNSIVGRVFKLYGSFCLNPVNFWENLNSSFIIGVEDVEALCQNVGLQCLSIDFVMSTFLYELEQFPEITDWEPKNFAVRLTSLLSRAIQAYDKGFHAHYFTRRNVLRTLWNVQNFVPEVVNDNELQQAASRPGSVPPQRSAMVLDDDDFGLHFDELSLDEREDIPRFHTLVQRKSTLESTVSSKGDELKQTRSLSKYIGTTLLRRLSMGTGVERGETTRRKTNRSMTDISAGFEYMVNQQRRDQIRTRSRSVDQGDDTFSSSLAFAETSFSESPAYNSKGIANDACDPRDSIYTSIFQLLNEISPSNYLSNTELITHLDNCRRVFGSQGELITAWTQVIRDIPRPKLVCPHTFSPRQIQSISLVIQTLTKCTIGNGNDVASQGKLPAWEIIGDILRIALCQMRAENCRRDSSKEKRKGRGFSFKGLRTSTSFSEGTKTSRSSAESSSGSRVSKFSFRSGNYDVCKYHTDAGTLDAQAETALAMEDPETAATHRLLQWLWQLRNSEVGRLSRRAQKFMEALYNSSLIQSHFQEQLSEMKVFELMAFRSAVAVSRIMADEKYPTHVPLITASKRGWQWSEMVLSFAATNEQKGNVLKAKIPKVDSADYVVRDIRTKMMTSSSPTGGQQTLKRIHNPTEPDTEALNLAFHSDYPAPLEMFEEPYWPGPYAVPILIYTSMGYFSKWEVSSGNIVHALVRLQKFIVLQHIATMLLPPHRKTAINEVRKLSKSLAFTAFQFEDNVMTKTFKRLASLRHTRRLFSSSSSCRENAYSCDEVKCQNSIEDETIISQHNGKSIECTKL